MECKVYKDDILNKFPVLTEDVSIHLSPGEGYLYIYNYKKRSNKNLAKDFLSISINDPAQALLSHFNGKRTLKDIIKELTDSMDNYNASIPLVLNFLNNIIDSVGFEFIRFMAHPSPKDLDITGSQKTFFPVHATLELTDKCNLRCSYCYKESDITKSSFLKNPIEFLESLLKIGIRHIELSGGEPLLHPDILKILHFAGEKFNLVALLTNGILINEKIINIIANFKDKFVVQICLDGSEEEIVDKIAGEKGAFKKIVNAIKMCSDNEIKIRVGMVVDSSKRIEDIERTLLLAKELGASWFVVNPAINIGRGKFLNLSFSMEEVIKFNKLLERLSQEHQGFFSLNPGGVLDSIEESHNCGAGHRTITINPNKIARPCPLFPEDLGSLYSLSGESFEKVIEERKEITKTLYKLKSPCEEVCGNCVWLAYCKNCFTRGLIKAKELEYNCKWFEKENIDALRGKFLKI